MPPRTLVNQTVTGPAPLQPKATPVDTFHRADVSPLTQGPSQMGQLAEALGQFHKPLLDYAVNLQNRTDTTDRNAGAQAVTEDKRLQTRKALADAVRNGQIPLAKNPAFLEGMRQQVYRIEGQRYDQALRESYAGSDSRNSADVTDFIGGFTQKYLGDLGHDPQDPEVASILMPAIERSQANLVAQHEQERQAVLEQQAEDNTGVEIGNVVDNAFQTNADPEFTAKRIGAIVQLQYHNGLDGTKGNALMVHSLINKANELKVSGDYDGAVKALDLIDKVPTGQGGQLGKIQWVRNAKTDALNAVYEHMLSSRGHNNTLAKQQKEAAKEQLYGDFLVASEQDPNFNIQDWVLRAANVDPELAPTFRAYDSTRRSQAVTVHETAENVTDLYSRVYDPQHPLTRQEVLQAARDGKITGKTGGDLVVEIGKRTQYSLLDDDVMKFYSGKISSEILGADYTKASPQQNFAANEAQVLFNRQMAEWISKNPQAAFSDKMTQADKIRTSIVNGVINSGFKAPSSSPAIEADAVDVTPKVHDTLDVLKSENVTGIDWKKEQVYADQEHFDQAVMKFNASKGQSGSLVQLAQKFDVSPVDMRNAQAALLRQQGAKPKK